MTEKRDAIVQVSVPFCVDDRALRREGMILGWDSARMARYADALVAEIEANAGQFDDCLVRAVQLGGGVASNAGADIARIVRAVRQVCDVAEDAPVAMRSSIANVSGATMPFFRRAGVTRFDFEMLSLNPVDFVRLNRVDNLNDLPIICDHFLHSYANDTLGLVLAFGHDASEGGDGALNVRRTALAAARSHATHAELVRVADELAAGCDEVAWLHGVPASSLCARRQGGPFRADGGRWRAADRFRLGCDYAYRRSREREHARLGALLRRGRRLREDHRRSAENALGTVAEERLLPYNSRRAAGSG